VFSYNRTWVEWLNLEPKYTPSSLCKEQTFQIADSILVFVINNLNQIIAYYNVKPKKNAWTKRRWPPVEVWHRGIAAHRAPHEAAAIRTPSIHATLLHSNCRIPPLSLSCSSAISKSSNGDKASSNYSADKIRANIHTIFHRTSGRQSSSLNPYNLNKVSHETAPRENPHQ
jgi:hypothetical protein